jgi:hypothetical protein
MWSIGEIVEGVVRVIDVVTQPRFHIPVFIGIAIALALLTWMPPSHVRDVLVVVSLVGGVAAGVVWDWGR